VKIGRYVIGFGITTPCICPLQKVNLWKQAQTMGIFGAVKLRKLRVEENEVVYHWSWNETQVRRYIHKHTTFETGSRHALVNSIHSFSGKSHKRIRVSLRLLVYSFSWRSLWSSYHSKTTRTNRASWRGFWRVFGRPRLESRPKCRLYSPRFALVFLRPLPLKSSFIIY